MLSEKQYLKAIMKHYSTHLGGKEIEVLLKDVSEPKLKEATLYLLQLGRCSGVDRHNLNHFLNFNNPGKKKKFVSGEALENAVRVSPTFKRIEVFIKRYRGDSESSTDPRNIEFLAWLAGYTPRPFEVFRTSSDKDGNPEINHLTEIKKVSEKEAHIKNHFDFNRKILKRFETELLIDVLKDLNLMEVDAFVAYRTKIDDDLAMQTEIILQLQKKVNQLENKLKQLKLAKRMAGGFGLFLVSVDYREPSLTYLFGDLLAAFSGLEHEDFFDELL